MPTNPPALTHAPPLNVPGLPVAALRRPAPRRRNVTLVLGALPQETELIDRALSGPKRGRLGPFPFREGRIAGSRVIVAATGIGKTCAAMITMRFAAHFQPREIVMTGTASRINPAVRNGDVIVGETVCNHDFGSLLRGFKMEYFGAEGPLGEPMPIIYPAAPGLLAAARRAIGHHAPEPAMQHDPAYVPLVRVGRITSGDQFGIPPERIADIRLQLAPDLMEMESGSVAEVCWSLRIPFLCVRGGSNLTQNSPEGDYRKLSPFASRQAALFTVSLLRELGRTRG
jgi:adenosylhomocysteine nucleosidase